MPQPDVQRGGWVALPKRLERLRLSAEAGGGEGGHHPLKNNHQPANCPTKILKRFDCI
jgi:hypothetical protein